VEGCPSATLSKSLGHDTPIRKHFIFTILPTTTVADISSATWASIVSTPQPNMAVSSFDGDLESVIISVMSKVTGPDNPSKRNTWSQLLSSASTIYHSSLLTPIRASEDLQVSSLTKPGTKRRRTSKRQPKRRVGDYDLDSF
jgi:hypothetical protein